MIDVTEFRPPFTMEPFRHRGIGELWMLGMQKPMARFLLRLQGIGDQSAVSDAELDAYVELMKGADGGRAFLKVMRNTERTPAKQALYKSAVRDVPYPVQIVWSIEDPAMKYSVYGAQARAIVSGGHLYTVPGKHFLQEDQAPAIAEHLAALIGTATHPASVPA